MVYYLNIIKLKNVAKRKTEKLEKINKLRKWYKNRYL